MISPGYYTVTASHDPIPQHYGHLLWGMLGKERCWLLAGEESCAGWTSALPETTCALVAFTTSTDVKAVIIATQLRAG